MKTIEGKLKGEGRKVAIVASRFNEFITKQLLEGAQRALARHGVDDKDILVAWVPGSFEVPLAAQTLAGTKKYDAVVCLGAVIRGSTPHFDYVAGESAKGVMNAGLQTGVPVVYGILTTENLEQAIERSGTKAGNKGFDAAQTALAMADLLEQIRK